MPSWLALAATAAQLLGVGDAGVGVAVADQQHRRRRPPSAPAGPPAGRAGSPPTGRSMPPAGRRRSRCLAAALSVSGAAAIDDLDRVVEGDQAEPVRRVEPVHQCGQRRLAPSRRSPAIEPLLSNTTTSVRGARSVGRLGGRGGQLDQQRHLVVALDRDDVQVQLGGDVHGFLRLRAVRYAAE